MSDAFAAQVDLFENLTGVLLFLWRLQKFSDSRWCTVGKACRTMVLAFATGLDSLAKFVLADKQAPKYHLNGFSKLSARSRRFIAVAALASYPSDSLLAELLEDDSVVPRLQFLQDVVQDELEWLSQLPSAVWRYMGQARI